MHIEVISRHPIKPKYKVPILCVHGGFHGAWCWDEYFLPFFAEAGFHAHALSLRGHGNSDGHEEINRWGITDYADDVATVASQFDTPPVLIGHSLGGIVVQEYLKKHKVAATLLLASSPFGGRLTVASLRHLLKHPLRLFKLCLTHDMLNVLPISKNLFFSDDLPTERISYFCERFDNESFTAFMDTINFKPPGFSDIASPLRVFSAQWDKAVPAFCNEYLAKHYKVNLETFPTAHDMMLETNWRLVAQRIISWLESDVLNSDE